MAGDPAALEPEHLVTPEDMTRWGRELSNWGRWGPLDHRGALNLITPQSVLAASTLIKTGKTYNLGIVIDAKAGECAIDL